MSKQKITLPACVLLDFDNTLYEYEPAHSAGIEAAITFLHQSLRQDPPNIRHHVLAARDEVKQRLGEVAASHSRLLYFSRAVELLGFKTQPKLALQAEQVYWSEYLSAATLREGALEFLDELRLLEIPVVVVTDLTASIQYRKLIYFGLDNMVDFVLSSEEAGADKPDPSIYQLSLAKLGGVEGAIWMIGDDQRCDMKGSKLAIGATTMLFSLGGSFNNEYVDKTFKHFNELTRILRRLAH